MLVDQAHAEAIAGQVAEQERLDQALEVLDDLDHAIELIEGNAIAGYYATEAARAAYSAHLDIFRAGSTFRERAALGGNRIGKTHLGAYEMACHLTGAYPDWWPGVRFERPITAWACGETASQVRDVVQVKLLGPHGQHGTGMIPRPSLEEVRRRQGVPEAVELVRVKHVSGGTSVLQFKSYSEGRETYQGSRIEFVWLDEEPPMPIYGECLLRTTKTSDLEQPGRILLTMTPMRGLSDVATHFLDDDGRLTEHGHRYAVQIGWDQVPHLTDTEKADLLESIPKHQRDARTRGYPTLGAGAVYSYSEDDLLCRPFPVPSYYKLGYGLDVGWNCTAAVFVVKDPDTETWWVVDEYKAGERTPGEHAQEIQAKAPNQFGAIDPASRGRSQVDGRNLLDEYYHQGLRLFAADNSVEAGIHRVQTLMATGKLRIFPHCTRLLAELRKYSRDENGRIRKADDHLLDALRYVIFSDKLRQQFPTNNRPKVKRAHTPLRNRHDHYR